MKKLISCLLAVMLFASLSAVPAFAAAVNLEEPVFSCDFEDFDATDDKFFDAEKPAGFPFFVGGSEGGGLQIVENGVGGTNSVTYFRAADTSESTNIRANVDASAYPAETKYGCAAIYVSDCAAWRLRLYRDSREHREGC